MHSYTGLDVVAAEHPHLVEGLPCGRSKKEGAGQEGDSTLRLCEANLARLALAPSRGKGGYAGSSSSADKGGARTARSVASAAGSVVVSSKYRAGGSGRSHCLRPPPSVTTAGTRLSMAETVIARAQARKGMF